MTTTWVYAELADEGPKPSAFELLAKARALGDDVAAVALGPGATAAAPALGEHGAARVFASDDDAYAEGLGRPQAFAIEQLVNEHAPELILFSTSYDARDVAGRLQARLGSTLMSNATDVTGDAGAQTQIFGGSRIVDVALEGPPPHLILVRPKSFVPEATGGTADVVPVDVDIPAELGAAKRLERHQEETKGPKLEEAKVVISGGRGLQECIVSHAECCASPNSAFSLGCQPIAVG